MEIIPSINLYFNDILTKLQCSEETKAYIISIYSKYKTTDFDLSQDSLTLYYLRARERQNFLAFQTIGDYLFFSFSLVPEHLKFASKDYYIVLAQDSYDFCYRKTNRQWNCYKQLSNNFDELNHEVREIFEEKIKI
jgi:hypothetical protein